MLSIFLFFNRNKTTGYLAVIFYVIILWAFGIWSYISRNTAKYDYFVVDSLAALMIITLCIVATAAFFHSYRYLEKYNYSETPHTKALFLASLVVLCTSIAASFISNHLAISWIFIELTTLSSSVLIYHHRNIRALEGVWKYVFVSAIGITLVYLGILFLSIALKPSGSQDLRFDNLYILSDKLNTFWLKLAFIFIFTGFTVKMGLVPLYTVGIDAKDKAPAPAGAIFASVLMNTGFIAIYRFYALVSKTPVKHWADSIIIFSAFLSLFIAAVYMTRIKNIKRMFAYSGIEHMGIIMIGLVSGGIGIYAAILHILLHSLIKPSLFFQYNQIYWVFQSKSIYDVGNYIKYNKTVANCKTC